MDRESLAAAIAAARARSVATCAPLPVEDLVVQTMPDVSPAKWHLAHQTWFFETFVLGPHVPAHRERDPRFRALFNSYYESVGAQHPRPQRGLLSRPTLAEVLAWRSEVDEALARFAAEAGAAAWEAAAFALELGLNHEEQHQELLLTDLAHVLGTQPLRPAHPDARAPLPPGGGAPAPAWIEHPGGLVEAGAAGEAFCFDNERPRHRVHLEPFALGSRLVTCGEWLVFMEDGGYDRPDPWMSDGWAECRRLGWRAPEYWSHEQDAGWSRTSLAGTRPLDLAAPVAHVSWYEADAFARWSGARLPREEEWEALAAGEPVSGSFLESMTWQPAPAAGDPRLEQLHGEAWQWTSSPHVAYPGYRPWGGAFGEYNGKFMASQMVLRGSSCVTPRRHARTTYRNFFPPSARWQVTGVRLARDLR